MTATLDPLAGLRSSILSCGQPSSFLRNFWFNLSYAIGVAKDVPLITREQRFQLLENGRVNYPRYRRGEPEIAVWPVVKLHVPGDTLIFLLSELHPENPDLAIALCDFGWGTPHYDFWNLYGLTEFRDLRRDDTF